MVQVVFVHGVATRGGRGYEDSKKNRDDLLKSAIFGQESTATVDLLDPDVPAVGTFLGDVFRYRKQGPVRDAIRARVRADLTAAWSDRARTVRSPC